MLLSVLALASPALAAQPSGPPRDVDSPRIQTTREANGENVEGAIQAPLRDLNVVRTSIPPVLTDAMADPYRRPPTRRCSDLVALLSPLNESLGPDLDDPQEEGRGFALSTAAGLASGALIPFRGWVRQLSGAEKHDRLVQSAITAGAMRRAYLKGLGEARGCGPPASPARPSIAATSAAAKPPGR